MRQISHLALFTCLLTLTACGDNTQLLVAQTSAPSTSAALPAAQAGEQEVDLDIQFSAFLDDGTAGLTLAPENMQGTVVARNIRTGEITTSPIMVHQQGGITDSLSTMNLKPGDYDLTLSFNSDGQFYIGQQFLQVLANTSNVAPILVSPVVGDTVLDIQTESLIDMEFNIALNEISAANITDPILEISIDGQIDAFLVDINSGSSQRMWLNIPSGDHDISVTLLDAGLVIGESQTQTINVDGADTIVVDIAPLYGQVTYDLFTDGGAANIQVNVPAAVIDTAGGVSNLDAVLNVISPGGPNFLNNTLTLVPEGGNYKANLTLPNVSYGDQMFDIIFFDMSKGAPIGNCFADDAFTSGGTTVSCQIQLHRDSVVSASLQSAVSVNVYDSLGFPVPGATVSVDGEATGVTGNDINATPGYTNVFVKPGMHIIRADFGSEFGEYQYESQALSSDNVAIILGQIVSTEPALFDEHFVANPTQGLFPEDNFWFGCTNGSGTPITVVESDSSRLALPSYPNECTENSAVTQLDFKQPEIDAAGGFKVELDLSADAVPGTELSIGIGEDPIADPISFNPSASADAVLTVRDSEVEINLYSAGAVTQTIIRPTPYPVSGIATLTLDVQLPTQFPGEAGTLNVFINGNSNFVEAIPFTWDGGSNHIELRGSGSVATGTIVKAYVDRMVVRPR